jgi:hypothetical protein
VHAAEKRFVASAVGSGQSARRHARAASIQSGVPGGCGIPAECTAAISSPASQSVGPGAAVAAYAMARTSAAPHAARATRVAGAPAARRWSAEGGRR